MRGHLRRAVLVLHVTTSVGWLGAVGAYLALAVSGLGGAETYGALELLAWRVLLPASLASLLTGLTHSLGTEWGLFRHYWVAAKFVLTTAGTLILMAHLPAVSRMAALAANHEAAGRLPKQLVVHAGAALVLLFVLVVLSIFKPWGRTPWGRRRPS